ncbi:MAG: T9SS type A sorting domain-containing protein [Bacteroidetes bacterium]|nr:T9SS type A sorting domain-containing protein [Bacteroidota bacterium]
MKNKIIKNGFIFMLVGMMGVNAYSQTINFDWAVKAGNSGQDGATDIISDASGNVYVIGNFTGTVDFDPSTSVYNLTSAGDTDVFVLKLDNAGALAWAVRVGGTKRDFGNAITLDGNGNVFITGGFSGIADFDPSSGVFEMTSIPHKTLVYKTILSDKSDAFILKLDNSGLFSWAAQVGASGYDFGSDLVADGNGNIWITGEYADYNQITTDTGDFDPSSGIYLLTGGGMFLLNLDNYGTFISASQFGKVTSGSSVGAGSDNFIYSKTFSAQSSGITRDADNNIYLTGKFNFPTDFDPEAGTNSLTNLGEDGFVLKLNSSAQFLFVKRFGGSNQQCNPAAIGIDQSGNIITTGMFKGAIDFDPGSSSTVLTSNAYNSRKSLSNNTSDIFISKLNNVGNYSWVKQIGVSGNDWGMDLAIHANGDIYSTGFFSGKPDFDPASGKAQYYQTSKGNSDVYIMKLLASGTFVWARQLGGTGEDIGKGISILESENTSIYTCGDFNSTVDFDQGSGTFNLTSAGMRDAFVHSMDEIIGSSPAPLSSLSEPLSAEFKIYPNPAMEMLNFYIPEFEGTGKITLRNFSGSMVKELTTIHSGYMEYPVAELSTGVYFITLETNNYSKTISILKK